MRTTYLVIRDFSKKWLLPIINVLIFAMAIYTAIAKLPLWSIVEPWVNVNVHRLLSLIGLSWVVVQINFSWLSINIPRLLRIVSAVLLAIRNKTIRQRRFWLASLPILGIVILNWLSRYWSISREFSESRFLYFSAVLIAGLYVGLEFKLSNTLRLFEVFSVIIVLGTYYVVIREPNFAIYEGGVWRGFFWWKSYLGEMTGFATIIFLFRWADFKKNHWSITVYTFILYILSLIVLFKSESVTQMLALITAHLVMLLMLSYSKWGQRLKTKHWWFLLATGLAFLFLLWLGKDYIFQLFGRETSLTGRLPMWEALVPYIKQRWLLGYGFGEAFWKYIPYRQVISNAAGWSVPFAHNGFIEVVLGIGFIGLTLWIVFLVQVTVMSVKFFLRERTIPSLIFLSWIAYIVVANMADNMLGSYEYFTVLLLVIAFSYMIRNSLDRNRKSEEISSTGVTS